ncbi:unnamed protein product [Somion occarium]|uniref:F-box domain-containing protein n=1 Tax=Somion occarium TaxID=3059160 RepID=A0ABP1DRG1_9APHY
MVRLPVEVEELILDHCIVSDNKANMAFMYSCALVCRAWAPRAQYNLFSSVFLNNANSQLFISALHRNPHLKYVTRSLEIDPDADVCSILVPLVGRLEFLEELTTSLNLGKENPALYMIAAQFHSIRKLTIVIRDKIVSTRNLIRLICCFPFLKDLSIYIPAGSILTDNPCAATTKSQIHLRRLFLRCRGFSGTTRLFDWLANSPSAIIDLRELKMVFSSAEELHRHSDEIARLLSRTGRSFLETSIVVLQARIPDTVTLLNALAPSNSANTRVSYIKFSMRPLSPNTIEYSVLFQYPTQTIRIIWRWTTPCHYLYYACYAKCRGPVSPSNAWNHEFCPRRSPLVSQASETKSLIDKNECYDNITIITRRIMRFCTTRSCFSLPSCTSTVARYDCTPHVGSPYSRLPKSRCSCTHPSRRSWRIQSQLRTQNTIPGPTHLHRRVQAWPVQNVVSLRITSCCMAGDLVLTESHMKQGQSYRRGHYGHLRVLKLIVPPLVAPRRQRVHTYGHLIHFSLGFGHP